MEFGEVSLQRDAQSVQQESELVEILLPRWWMRTKDRRLFVSRKLGSFGLIRSDHELLDDSMSHGSLTR